MDIKRFNGKIYSIRSYQTDLIYIGSTIEKKLSARFGKHRAAYKSFIENKYHYMTAFEILIFNDAYIELIEEVEKKTKNELQQLEGEYIRQNKCVNKRIEGRTHKEYDNTHKEERKAYCIKNQEKIKLKVKEYRETHKLNEKYICECGKSLSNGNKARHDKVCKATVIC